MYYRQLLKTARSVVRHARRRRREMRSILKGPAFANLTDVKYAVMHDDCLGRHIVLHVYDDRRGRGVELAIHQDQEAPCGISETNYVWDTEFHRVNVARNLSEVAPLILLNWLVSNCPARPVEADEFVLADGSKLTRDRAQDIVLSLPGMDAEELSERIGMELGETIDLIISMIDDDLLRC